jgi:hypothetical protein
VGGELVEPENFADMLENHEPRRCGGVPLGLWCFSIDPDLESGFLEDAAEAASEGPFCCPFDCPFGEPFD